MVFEKIFNKDNINKKTKINKFYKLIKEIYEQLLSLFNRSNFVIIQCHKKGKEKKILSNKRFLVSFL